ncbi:hypothetical protein ACOMHN_026199 [Nucella lapillus]
MFREDKIHGGVVRLGGALVVVCTLLTCSDGRRREFFKPPSSCLTGASCALCEETARFFSQEVCCYQCRLDNVVIDGDLCHCINTRVADPPHIAGLKVRGNCSRGKACDNCSVKISTDASLGARASPGIVPFCCPDCGLVVPYFQRDEHGGCYCDGDPQGREHEVAPRYDPSKNPTTSTPPPRGAASSSHCCQRCLCGTESWVSLASLVVLLPLHMGLHCCRSLKQCA